MKRNAVRPNVEFLVKVLNEGRPCGLAGLLALAKEHGVFFSEKELFVLSNTVHVYNAIFAFELYKI